jgi:hypothetical protein
MMKQIALTALAVVTLATATVSTHTEAQAKNNNGGAFLAGAIIGGAAAIIAGSAYGADRGYDRPRRDRGYDRPHRDHGRKVCEVREQFNKWGEYVGSRKICWTERARY